MSRELEEGVSPVPTIAERPIIDEGGPAERLYELVRSVLWHVGIQLRERPPKIHRPSEPCESGWYANVSNYAMGEADYDLTDEQAITVLADLG